MEVEIEGWNRKILPESRGDKMGVCAYGFNFNTHSGSRNDIPRHYLDWALRAAEAVAKYAKKYDFDEYEEHRK